MTILFLLSVLVGAVLGMRLSVLILIPVTGIVFVAIAGVVVVRGEAQSLIALAMAFAAISLQLGYLVGSTTRFVLVAARVSRRHKIHTPAQAAMAGNPPTISA